jgi:hypothetical protein
MSRLEIAAGQGPAKKSTAETQKKETVPKKTVKVAAADVALLVRCSKDITGRLCLLVKIG